MYRDPALNSARTLHHFPPLSRICGKGIGEMGPASVARIGEAHPGFFVEITIKGSEWSDPGSSDSGPKAHTLGD